MKDIVGSPKPKARKHKRKARIYHPTDKSKSYGGYGPKPAWLKEMEATA